MNILSEFNQQLLTEDGSYIVALRNKLVHVCVGALSGFICLYFFHSIILACVVALVLGIIRELTKTTPLLLHIVTALITGSGALLALPLCMESLKTSIIICCVMVLYCISVTIYQVFG